MYANERTICIIETIMIAEYFTSGFCVLSDKVCLKKNNTIKISNIEFIISIQILIDSLS